MSFGFSVSDVLSITQLAWKTIQNSRKACGEHDDFTREVSSLHLVLQRLQQEIEKPESPLNRPSDNASKELQSTVEGCQRVLKRVNTILKKHDGLTQKESSRSKLWQKVRFGNGQVQELAQLRTKISYYVSALTLFLNMVSTGTMGRVEKKMDDTGGDLTKIRITLNGITAQLMSKNQQEGSVFTTYADDDKAVWREFRRELIQESLPSSVIHKNKKTIKAYIKELASRGVLDDVDEPSDIGAEPMPTVSESGEPSERPTKFEGNISPATNTTMDKDEDVSRPSSVAPRRRPGMMRAAEKSKGSKLTFPDVKLDSQNTIHSSKSYNNRVSIIISRRPAMRRAETMPKQPESRKSDVDSNSEDNVDSDKDYSSPPPTTHPQQTAMKQAETMSKEPELKDPDVKSKPRHASVETGSLNSEVDQGHASEANSDSSQKRSTDDDHDVDNGRCYSKDEPPQGDVPNSVNTEDLDEGLRLLSVGYDGRDLEKPPDSSESRLRCRSCYFRLSKTSFVRLRCSHYWCFHCLKAIITSYVGGDGVPISPFILNRQTYRCNLSNSSAWIRSISDLSVCNRHKMRLKCCAECFLTTDQFNKCINVDLETEHEKMEERSSFEHLQFCPKQGCRAWIVHIPDGHTGGIYHVDCPNCLAEIPTCGFCHRMWQPNRECCPQGKLFFSEVNHYTCKQTTKLRVFMVFGGTAPF